MVDFAYLQKNPEHGEFISVPIYTLWDGCRQLGIQTKSFTQDEINTIDISRETLVTGGVGIVRKAFTRLGVPQPTVGEIPPKEVLDLYGRHIWSTTMAEVRQGYEDGKHFFIKPLKMHKEFSGHVTSGDISRLAMTAYLPNDFEILASEIMNFQSEYRLFIHKGKIVSCKFYRGDFRKLVDFAVAEAFLEKIQNPPIGYSLDLGVAENEKTYIVEINDAFSLGNYGLSSIIYTKIVIDRWEEIVGI